MLGVLFSVLRMWGTFDPNHILAEVGGNSWVMWNCGTALPPPHPAFPHSFFVAELILMTSKNQLTLLLQHHFYNPSDPPLFTQLPRPRQPSIANPTVGRLHFLDTNSSLLAQL
jgi:hypothetical protein